MPSRQAVATAQRGDPWSLILDLPDPPVGSFDAPNPEAFAWVTAIAMPYGVHEHLLQAKVQLGLQMPAANWLQQQLQQRGQLQGGGRDVIEPTQGH